jgi:7-cyano-7-deazaguanine synthase
MSLLILISGSSVSALTSDIGVPKERSVTDMSHGIPITYVPARNTTFLSFALAWAETLRSSDIFIGVKALDYRLSRLPPRIYSR